MMFTISNSIFLIALSIGFYVFAKLFTKKRVPSGLKPLPILEGWPIVGNMLSIHGPLCRFLLAASKKYGPIFSFKMGLREIVVLSSNKILSKTLKDQGNNFSGRWKTVLVQTVNRNSGIIFTDKEWWATQRSFALKVLKDFGLGKQRSTDIVDHECSILLKEIEESCGEIISVRSLFPKFTVNVIAKLVMNMRFEREQKDFKSLTSSLEKLTQSQSFIETMIVMFPIFERLPTFSNFLFWCSGRLQDFDLVHNYMRGIINDHRSRFNIENEGEDFIDIFLKEQCQLEKDKVKDHTFTEWQLIRVVLELFIAGYETTSTTLTWSMLIMAKHQDVQEKVYQELLDVIGSNRMPNLSDKKSLPYTQAVMDEIFRLTSVVPLSLTHRVLENTDVEGYFIPKNSIVFPNLYACHRDKDVWEKPFDFYPEHFLTKSDNNEIKYKPRNELVPFSIGKRQCLGEALARMEFFIFLTSIIQRFKIRFGKIMNEEDFIKMRLGTSGLVRASLTSDVVFEMRV